MAEYEKRAKRYPTDLTDGEWETIRSFLPVPPKRGRTPSTDLREVSNALRYLARSGGSWRFHDAIIVWCTPCLAASSAGVRSPRIASSATLALKSAL